MSEFLEFRLNGKPIRAKACSPNTTLLQYLRQSGLTAAKEGCAEGDCGACSVAILDRGADGRATFRCINSCLVPLPMLAGREIVTTEGLRLGPVSPLHPVQASMVAHHGSQCGYCTPGFVMSLFEGFHRKDLATEQQLEEQLCGNLCRCTGYRSIHAAAVEAFSHERADAYSEALSGSVDIPGLSYQSGEERFLRPVSLAELFTAMAAHPDARLVAGATELGLEITKRFRKFATLISLEAVSELSRIESADSEWRMGAAVNLTTIQDLVAPECPAISEMLRWFGSRQIRNRATLGGNLATASPIGDSAPVLLTYATRLVLASAEGERELPLDQFFLAYRKTALRPGEIVKLIVIPRHDGFHRRFYKVSKRREMDISTVSACFALRLDGDNRITDARIAYGGVAPTPVRAHKTEAALVGRVWDAATLAAASEILATEFAPIRDVRGSEFYRRGLIVSLLDKFFEDSISESADPSVRSLPIAGELSPTGASSYSPGLRSCPGSPTTKDISPDGAAPAEHSGLAQFPPSRIAPHESAHKHVTGEARYVDDETNGMLVTWPVCSPHARARILRRDATAARAMPGVQAVLLAEDIPGSNDTGPVRHDEVLLATDEISYHGQIVAVVVGGSQEICRAAADLVVVEYEPLPALLDLSDAVRQSSFHSPAHHIRRGDAQAVLAAAPQQFSGEFALGGQDHFYLETQAAWAECGEDHTVFVHSSTQHPSEVQTCVAHLLALPMHSVVVQSTRMGGGFGGKETQAAIPAAIAALAASITGKRVRVRFNRDQDMAITGKRHPFLARFEVGHDADGRLLAAKIDLYSNAGWSLDLSGAITDRALFHLDNAYYIPAVDFGGTPVKTNLASNTAFRGFGGPQGMLVIEEIIDRIARRVGLPPEVVRERNLYRGSGETNTTHYGQEIEDNRIERIWRELMQSSQFAERRAALGAWNAKSPHRKRGIAITPVKFGISFTTTHLNQAGALVLLYQDGTVQVNHGATEMGQGVYTNIATIAAKEFGIPMSDVRVMATRTDKVPNTSATAASCGTDLNGAAVKNACDTLNARLAPYRARHPGFREAIQAAYFDRASLSATGFYKTPDIWYDTDAGHGKPFHYFAVGAAVSEVEGDLHTGMVRLLRTDILHDVGDPINAGIARGQVEGGFIQGMGWLTMEELLWNKEGALLTHSPDTYKIPAYGDTPPDFRVAFLSSAAQPNVIHGSKAVGEPPLMLAISVREAIRDMIASARGAGEIPLASPATAEAIYRALQRETNAL